MPPAAAARLPLSSSDARSPAVQSNQCIQLPHSRCAIFEISCVCACVCPCVRACALLSLSLSLSLCLLSVCAPVRVCVMRTNAPQDQRGSVSPCEHAPPRLHPVNGRERIMLCISAAAKRMHVLSPSHARTQKRTFPFPSFFPPVAQTPCSLTTTHDFAALNENRKHRVGA